MQKGKQVCTSSPAWATGGKSYARAYADGGFVGGLASGVQAGLTAGDEYTTKRRKKDPSAGTQGTTGTGSGENLPSILKPEGNAS